MRERYQLAVVPDAEIYVVQDAEMCRRAARIYHRTHPDSAAGIEPRMVVVAVGPTRFAVRDADRPIRAGEFTIYLIMDAAGRIVAQFAS